jgi:hypothetical protein
LDEAVRDHDVIDDRGETCTEERSSEQARVVEP